MFLLSRSNFAFTCPKPLTRMSTLDGSRSPIVARFARMTGGSVTVSPSIGGVIAEQSQEKSAGSLKDPDVQIFRIRFFR